MYRFGSSLSANRKRELNPRGQRRYAFARTERSRRLHGPRNRIRPEFLHRSSGSAANDFFFLPRPKRRISPFIGFRATVRSRQLLDPAAVQRRRTCPVNSSRRVPPVRAAPRPRNRRRLRDFFGYVPCRRVCLRRTRHRTTIQTGRGGGNTRECDRRFETTARF